MRTRVVAPPAPIISLVDAKKHLRVDWEDDDALIEGLVQAAVQHIDGPTGWVGRCFGPQTLEAVLERWERTVRLPCEPIIGIESVKYLDGSGVLQTVAPADYGFGSSLWFRSGWSAPAVGRFPDPIRIRYRAGYNGATGAGAGEVQTGELPFPVRAAILLHVGHLYANREAASAEGQHQLPMAYDALLSPYRIWSI